jgi:hypothetical protein
MKNFIQTTKNTINTLLVNFTLAKFIGALVTIITVALIKYMVSGNFHIEYSEFSNNMAIGILGWTINTATIGWLSEYLGVKGINFNLKQFLYGYHTMGADDSYSSKNFKAKLYNAMESDDGSDPSKQIDKGKGIDKVFNETNNESAANPLNKGNSDDIESIKRDIDYWQLQIINYKDILNTFDKPKHLWTKEEWALVAQQIRYEQYNRLTIQQCLNENMHNLSGSIKDLKAKGISDTSILGKHSSTSLTENHNIKKANKND